MSSALTGLKKKNTVRLWDLNNSTLLATNPQPSLEKVVNNVLTWVAHAPAFNSTNWDKKQEPEWRLQGNRHRIWKNGQQLWQILFVNMWKDCTAVNLYMHVMELKLNVLENDTLGSQCTTWTQGSLICNTAVGHVLSEVFVTMCITAPVNNDLWIARLPWSFICNWLPMIGYLCTVGGHCNLMIGQKLIPNWTIKLTIPDAVLQYLSLFHKAS